MPADPIKKVLMLKSIKIKNRNHMWVICIKCGEISSKRIGCRSCVILEKSTFINDCFRKGWDIIIDKRGRNPICPKCK